jgi:putative FmdB family regulatory protein
MPVYEYQCEACKHRYAVLVPAKDSEEIQPCAECGGEKVQKLVSSVSVVRSGAQKEEDRGKALRSVDPTKPQDVARYFKEHGSRFGDEDFRGTDTWQDAVDRVAEGGPTLEDE